MQRRALAAVGILGLAAVALYVGATLLGSILDPNDSQIANAISELTGPDAPNRTLMGVIYIAYNLLVAGFGYALLRASSGGLLFKVTAVLFAIGAVSGIGQVTAFRIGTVTGRATAPV